MNILFVCTGNTCRSPMAEGYLRSKKIDNITVSSRGLMGDASPVSANSVKAMLESDIDISSHISSQISKSDVDKADRIICLSNSHIEYLESAGVDSEKLSLLGNGIPDPFGGSLEIYRKCRDEIFMAIDKLCENGLFNGYKIASLEQRHIAPIAKLESICFSEPWSADSLLESYKNGTHFFVAENKDFVLGYIGLSAIIDEGYITNVAVFPKFRKQGVATSLLNAVFDFAKEKKLAFVSLEVRKSNLNAISLYEKTGFKTEGLRTNFYRNPREDALIMTRRFDYSNENT